MEFEVIRFLLPARLKNQKYAQGRGALHGWKIFLGPLGISRGRGGGGGRGRGPLHARRWLALCIVRLNFMTQW